MKNLVHPTLRLWPLALLLSLIALLLAYGCKKDDPCENVTCLNGGICVDGTCICQNGFTGANCSTPPDPCAGITCLNGGTCANGSCNCPQMWTGSDCSLQKTPSKIEVKSVTITGFPPTNPNGGGWDPTDGTGPDIYIQLLFNGIEIFRSGHHQDAIFTESYTFTLPTSPGVFLYSPNEKYTIRLYDKEVLFTDQFMGAIEFTPYHSTNGFPIFWTLDDSNCTGCPFEVRFNFKYHY